MSDVQYESICQKVWAFYEANQAFALQGNGRRNILFPPPRRSRPVDLLVVGMSPNQAAPINYTHTFDGLKAFAHSFRYVSEGERSDGEQHDPYYRKLLLLFRRVDEGFGVWWEVESGNRQLLVEFTDALHVATDPNTDDIDRFVSPGVRGGSDRRKLCKNILELELAYYQPKVVIGNGRLPSDLLWEICTGKPVEGSPVECLTRYKPCNSIVHLSGFLTSKSMDAYSKARLLKELKEHSPFVERQDAVEVDTQAHQKPIEFVDGAQLSEAFRHVQAALKQPQQPTVASAAPGIQAAPETPARPRCPPCPRCPRCGSQMVPHRAQKGPNAGKEFWGCSTFHETKCGVIRTVE
jgi:hypothetical protein